MTPVALRLLVGFAASVSLIPFCRIVAAHFGCVAVPRQERWNHRPTPLFGGVAIALVTIFGALLSIPLREIWLISACGAAIFIVGFVDDLISLKPSTKLVAQIALASVLLFFGYRLHWLTSLTLDALITAVWIVGVTNAFNLLDNMDGLCAGIASIVGITLLADILVTSGVTPDAQYLALLIGGMLGFLAFNFHPASIFMGDSGSLFIGLTVAILTLNRAETQSSIGGSGLLSVVAAPVLVLLIPIFDTTLVTLSRLFAGRRPSEGGRDHSSHRLVAIGLPERTAVLVLYGLSAMAGAVAFSLGQNEGDLSLLSAGLFVLAIIVFAAYLSQVRVYEDAITANINSRRITPLVVAFMHKRRVAEVLLDLCLVPIAYYSAYRLRFEGDSRLAYFASFLQSLPIVLGAQMVALFAVGAYRGVWRYFGLMDGVVLAKAVAVGVLVAQLLILYLYRFENYSRAVFVIYAILLMLLLTASRASFRLISEFAQRRKDGRRLIIYGAATGSLLAVREVLPTVNLQYRILGFIDDDSTKRAVSVQGYPVLGDYIVLRSLVKARLVDAVIVTKFPIDLSQVQDLERICSENAIALYRLRFELEALRVIS